MRGDIVRIRPGQIAATPFAAARSGGGFTLVEVLIVIFILGVLAAIVASVAGYVMKSASSRETAATQKVLLEAIQAYHDASNPKAYPFDHDPSSTPDPNNSGNVLANCLIGKVPGQEARTRPLPRLRRNCS